MDVAPKLTLVETQLGLRNSTTRLPFRYGYACLTRCPQAILMARIEIGGRSFSGYSGDCFPPGWFDKSPDKSFASQIDDMILVIQSAEQAFRQRLHTPDCFFPAWRDVDREMHELASRQGLPELLASFGVSMVERAIMDAICRGCSLRFHQALRENVFGIRPGAVHACLNSLRPSDWMAESPSAHLVVRHTVGLTDPLTNDELAAEDQLHDGFPQALEEYIRATGIYYLKIKVSNELKRDMHRLISVARLIERHRGSDYRVTLDGNEQYKESSQFDQLVREIQSTKSLVTLWNNTLAIEQPLDRRIALDAAHTEGIRELSKSVPVIIDESDGSVNSYLRAIELGYRGVSSKNCKGPLRAILNAGITWHFNKTSPTSDFIMTAEDLCCVGIVPVQADMCLVASLGIPHVERNGHHYHAGIGYLPSLEQEAALRAHGDLYRRQNGVVAPYVDHGRFHIKSLDCVGFGFAVEPDMSAMIPVADWRYSSLGLDE
jgi:hypothetical protein